MTLFETDKNDYELLLDFMGNHLTAPGYELLCLLLDKVPNVEITMLKPASSTGKYHHHGPGGIIWNVAKHTYLMVAAVNKIVGAMGSCYEKKSDSRDIFLLGTFLHDIVKYGNDPETREFTIPTHDKLGADFINENRSLILTYYQVNQFVMIRDIVRYHNGRYSNNFRDIPLHAFFVHFLDMLESRDCLKDVEEQYGYAS